jgi:flagellar biosynthesis protein FliQ
MDDSIVLNLCHQAFLTALYTSGPILLAVLVIGVAVSILQAVTQIQEATLTFVPKMLGAGLVMVFGGYWMLNQIVHFTEQLLSDLPHYAH